MRLTTTAGRSLEVVQAEVGSFSIWVRQAPKERHWDIDVTRPILDGDEYELAPLAAEGHQPLWIVDIGAHIGSFTLKAKSHWPNARVIAAEPDPDSAALFRRNTDGLQGVFLHETAVLGTESSPEAHLRQAGRANEDRNAAASWVAEAVQDIRSERRAPTLTVPCISVLELLRAHGNPTIDLLKLDCEAAEGEILSALGTSGYLRRVGWIRGEWHHSPNVARIESALERTHTFHLDKRNPVRGAFIAHRNRGA